MFLGAVCFAGDVGLQSPVQSSKLCHQLQDKYGISLLAYASGISSERANKLLDIILDSSPRKWAGLVCCTNITGACRSNTEGDASCTGTTRDGVS